ncbi:unnamed protein product [Rotaria sp. Silwood2]|nr:unnamed protein product [Rotaria sp. Silwood2]CAF3377129.1 unnamed protein product [Rotaria sp. Silwood2]CAF4112728.1 unnamed protein product [Rotaria sp. Silwood2]CAF4350509.1 unnamed protein product [Rotaria sp. Silwood2]
MDYVRIDEAINKTEADFGKIIKWRLDQIWQNKKIENDHQMGHVMTKLQQMEKSSSQSEIELSSDSREPTRSELLALIGEYQTRGHETNINVLSLDGGGTRGHMSIKVLCELITEIYIDHDNQRHNKGFVEAQSDFTDEFDYLVGTSTGGLIAFCLAIKHDLFDIKQIYEDCERYFKRQWFTRFGPIERDKYNPTPIYNKIDEIIGQLKLSNGKQLTAENATLLDIHNLLNPHCMVNNDTSELDRRYHSNCLEFVDDSSSNSGIKREKVLLITAYNTTKDSMTIFNTSYAEHWGYRIADVLKATMAAPTYFQPCTMYKRKKVNDHFERDGEDETFIDGGVFANDPELAALWAIRMQWKKPINYRLLSIGTGCYNAKLSVDNWKGGYKYWLYDTNGLLVNVLMDGTRSLTETVMNKLATFGNIKRMKFNYKLKKSMELDDPNFAKIFNAEWEQLKTEDDYQVLVYFYKKYIKKEQNSFEQ